MPKLSPEQHHQLIQHRLSLLDQLDDALDKPMIFLGFAWLALFVLDVVNGPSRLTTVLGTIIWAVFIFDFILKFWIAPHKWHFLKTHVITVLALAIPALRIFRIFRVLRLLELTGGTRVVQVVGSVNRSMASLRATLGRRGFGYVSILSLLVAFAGAAGIYALERGPHGIKSFGMALYWSIMMITTIGSEYWPHSVGGRVLTVLLSLYAVAILGYIAATLSTFFIDRDAESKDAALAGQKEMNELKQELAQVRALLEKQLGAGVSGGAQPNASDASGSAPSTTTPPST